MLKLAPLAVALAAAVTSGVALPPVAAAAESLPNVAATAATSTSSAGFDGVVEAVRQTVIAAQVPGAVVQLDVRAGDRVQPGQILLRIDARSASQSALASDAQVQAARAQLDVASREYERQQRLFQKNYISQAALEQAESLFKATQAQVKAQLAQADVARTQTGLHVVRAPYAGVVSEVPVALGEMALPGRPLISLYDPTALRVTASVPQTVAARIAPGRAPEVELPGLGAASRRLMPTGLQILPTVDAATHTVELRATLPAGVVGAVPGLFARLWLPLAAETGDSGAPVVWVPAQAVVRRAEMIGLYVLDASGRPLLRQVRLGPVVGDRVQVLAGLAAGERVVTDPQAAARAR